MPIIWNGRRTRAFVPELLSERDLALSRATVARTAVAASEVGHAAGRLTVDYEPLARLLLRAEGLASSFIEGVIAPVVDVVVAERDMGGPPGAAAWVAANLAAVSEAVASAQQELSVELLCEWHRILMTGSPVPERHVGRIREEQGWIGGTSPFDAHLVTPPPEDLPELLEDMVSFSNGEEADPIAQAAVAHAQFEVIHPFADGNGRVGRILVAWLLSRRLSLLTPPPISVAVAADVGGYAAGLALFRLGRLDEWVHWFADAVGNGAKAQTALVNGVEELRREWETQLSSRPGHALRSDAAAWRVLDLIPRVLVLTSESVSSALGVTNKAATAALHQLADAGVLLEHGTSARRRRGRPAKLFLSRDLLALVGSSPLR